MQRDLSVPLQLQLETQGSTRGMAGNLCSSRAGGFTQGSSQLVVGPPLELPWGNSCLAGVCRMAPFLLQSARGYSLVLAWDFSSCGQGQFCSCGGFNSL